MADPLSIVAIVGLALAGRNLSRQEKPQQPELTPPPPIAPNSQPEDNRSTITNSLTGQISSDLGLSGVGVQTKEKYEQPNFGDIVPTAGGNPNGMPVQDFRDRPWVSGQMNNLSPVQKELVGPALGVGPNVPAYGGYQQLFRVKPNNVGAYRLTTLPGRSGPAGDVSGGKQGQVGQLTHNKPETVAFLPQRRPQVAGRAQGQGGPLTGVTVREKYERTKRPTNRSETTTRTDGLEYAPAKHFTSAETLAQDPTRNKGDNNTQPFYHVNNPAPNIYSFVPGYTQAPGSQLLKQRPASAGYSAKQLEQYGFRPDDRRGKSGRKANPGRMNVREGPLNQGGALTAVRKDSNKYDGRTGPANGGWTQNYIQDEYYQLNPYKGQKNIYSSSRNLNVAKNQLAKNPFAHTLAA